MSLLEHAKRELNADSLPYEAYDAAITRDVLELIETFAKQGHSGASAAIVRQLFNELAQFNTVTPLTGKDDEFEEISPNLLQNIRNSAVFKDTKKNTTYYINAIAWEDENGSTFTNKQSSLDIAQFPFTPKTFYVKYNTKTNSIVDTIEFKKAKEYYAAKNQP